VSYRATVDVPIATVRTISGWLTAYRRTHDTRPHQRAATTWVQAVLVLRWLKDGTDVRALARDSGGSQATAYRYLHEALELCAWTALWCALTGSQPAPRPATTCGTRVLHKAFAATCRS